MLRPFIPAPWMLAVCLLAVGATALAQPAADTAQAHLDEARRLYDSLEYERALEALARAQRRSRTEQDTLSILLHEGIILFDMGKSEEAFDAFKAALQLRPDAQLPIRVSPKTQLLFDHMRKMALRGLYFFLSAEGKYRRLREDKPLSDAEAAALRDAGKRQQNLARVSVGVGSALLLAGGIMALLGPTPVEPQMSMGHTHVSLGLAGELPW